MTELDTLRVVVDSRLTGIRRVFHVLGGEIDRSEGGVELRFSSGHTIYGEAGPDGDSLSIRYEPWADPFEGRMTPENAAYVAEVGKAEAIDVSGEQPFRDLVGGEVTDVCSIVNASGKQIGVVFVVAGEMLTVWVNSDETFATVLP